MNSKQTQFSIQADNSTYPPSIYKIQNGIIAYVMNQNEWFVDGKKVSLVATVNDKQFDFNVTYPIECTQHDWDEGEVTTEPSCTKEGIKTYTCKNCATTKTETIKSLGHDYSSEWTTDEEATCTQEGSKSHHCTRCDDKKDVTTIAKKDHEWDNGTITKEPTNKDTGIKTYKCKICNGTKTEKIPVMKEDLSVDSEAPVIDMSTLKLSSNRVVVGDKVQIAVKVTDNVEVSKVLISFRNSETSKLNNIELKFNEKSDLYEGVFSVTEDISSGSWYIYDIEAYDAVGNQNLKLLDENDYSIIVDNPNLDSEAPVIYKDTVKFNQSMATTGDSVILSVKITDNIGIKNAKFTMYNEETNKQEFLTLEYNKKLGLYEGLFKIKSNMPSGHWFLFDIEVYDSVDNYGSEPFFIGDKHWVIVTRNNKDVHKWNEGIVTTEPLCTKEGIKTFECSICNKTKTEAIKSLGHDYSSEWTIDKAATCTQEGSKSHHCTRCDDKKDVTTISKTNHNWDSGVETTKAICIKDGVKTYTCKDCKTTKTEVIKALGHDYSSEWTIDKEATCTQEGSKSHHCTRCDDKKDVTRIETLNHSWELTSTIKSTKDKEGKNIYTCSLCNEKREEVIAKLIGKWITNNNGKWFGYPDDTYENTGFKKINEDTYYFQSNGYVKTGWLLENDVWYYFNKDGIMQTGWSGPGRQYYFDDAGKMLEKQFTPDGYYVGSSGAYVRNGWVLNNEKYYYMNGSGKMIKCSWVGSYYLGSDGVMVTNKWVQWNEKYYYLDSQGVYVNNKWIGSYYLDSNGAMATNRWVGNYWCGSDGQYVKSSWVDNNRYYVNNKGLYVAGSWQKDSVGWYYRVGNDYAKNITLNINGAAYMFDSRGYWAS